VLAVHALWSAAGRLCLWAEDPALPATAPPRRGRPARVPQPRLHPFACPTPGLRELLGDDLPEGAAVDAELTLLLPSGRRGPLASPELVRGQLRPLAQRVGVL
jgi:hypothetical protein